MTVGKLPKRRRFILSLRVFLVLIAVLGVWLAWTANRARDQKRAREAIVKIRGGVTYYDWQEPIEHFRPQPDARPYAPGFVRRVLGDDPFQTITSVAFLDLTFHPPLPRASLAAIARLPNVTSLNLWGVELPSGATSTLARMTSLEMLILPGPQITDDDLAPLASMRNLTYLGLNNSLVVEGTKHLSRMTRLETLVLINSHLNDAGLEHLVPLRSLKRLNLTGTAVSDAALVQFMKKRPDVQVTSSLPYR